jgi:hypothetical protein
MPWLIHAHPKLPADLKADSIAFASGYYHYGIKIFAFYDDKAKKDVGWVVREGAEMYLKKLPDTMNYEIVEYDDPPT